ncbi:MAG: hypothetical protein IJ287_08540, partial [Methanobrevibacter sp.]|nr:hypothetical protein [Methanobrevibacter sp.]
ETIPENNTPTQNETIPENNTPTQNETIPENNTPTQNETIPENNTPTQNETIPENNETKEKIENNTIISKTGENKTPTVNQNEIKETNLLKHSTGNELTIVGILILIVGFILLIKYMRD